MVHGISNLLPDYCPVRKMFFFCSARPAGLRAGLFIRLHRPAQRRVVRLIVSGEKVLSFCLLPSKGVRISSMRWRNKHFKIYLKKLLKKIPKISFGLKSSPIQLIFIPLTEEVGFETVSILQA